MSPEPTRPPSASRFALAMRLFDAANAEDPNLEHCDGREYPKQLLYAERMSRMLQRFSAAADEEIQLAVRAQHIRRWVIPRQDYPKTTQGYRQWRIALYQFHAETAATLLRQAGYDEDSIARISNCIAKRGIKSNPATQLLEDVAALVFLEYYLAELVSQHADYDESKWVGILQKTLRKMSPEGRAFALGGGVSIAVEFLPLLSKAAI